MMVRTDLNTRGGKLSIALRLSACVTTMSVLAAFTQAPNCTLITVPDTDEWRDWKVESIAGVTDEGVAAGTLVYTGNDTNVRVRKRIFRWNRADERITIFDPPLNDNEANLVTGVEALDLSVDGTAIAGRITYQGRPSAAFVFRGGVGYRILKQRQALGQTTIGLALSGRAVGYKGYHLAVQPSNDSAFVVPDPFGGSSSLNLRCGMSLPERIPVRVQRCTWSPLQGQNEIAEIDDIDETLEFMWIDEQGTVSSFILRGRDLFGRGWIPPWRGGGDQNIRGNERFHVLDISPDGRMVAGSMEVLRRGCYTTSSGYVFQLDPGEYVMKAERLIVGLPDGYDSYAYLAEFKPFFEEQPIRGRATCMAGYQWGNYGWAHDDMCYANSCRLVAGVLYPYGGRSGRAFIWYGWGTGDNDSDHWNFFASGLRFESDPVQVSKVSGVSADHLLLLLGRQWNQPMRGYTGYWNHLGWYDLWGPLPAPSECVDTFAMSPSGRFVAVKYEDGQCLSGAAVIDISLQQLNGERRPDEVKVVYRNLTRPQAVGASYPYLGDLVEVRLFLRYGSIWYTKDCPIDEVLRSRWFENGSVPASSGAGEYYKLRPTVGDYEKIWRPSIVRITGNLDSSWYIFWYYGHHSVDTETQLTPFCSTPCTANVRGNNVEVGWKRFYWYPEMRILLTAFNRYAFTMFAGQYNFHPGNDYDFFRDTLTCPTGCFPGTVRFHARLSNSFSPGHHLRRVHFSSAPTPGRYRPPREDDNSRDESLWSQNCDEPDELAVRISVRARTGNAFVDWASAFLNVPYEFGGQGFGARADNQFDSSVLREYSRNSCGATHQGLENYGIDCSGLVVAAYNLAGYDTPDMGASSFIDSNLFDSVALSDIRVGDILASKGHVMIIYKVDRIEDRTARVTILEAAGAPAHRVRLVKCTLRRNPNHDPDQVSVSFDNGGSYSSTFHIRRRIQQ